MVHALAIVVMVLGRYSLLGYLDPRGDCLFKSARKHGQAPSYKLPWLEPISASISASCQVARFDSCPFGPVLLFRPRSPILRRIKSN